MPWAEFSPESPWAEFSPDGIIIDQIGDQTKILEIKCPIEGKTLTCNELIEMNAIKAIDANNNIKKNTHTTNNFS